MIIKLNLNSKEKLREKQMPVINKCLSSIKDRGGGIISLPCGFGKTVIALYIACQLKLKVLGRSA